MTDLMPAIERTATGDLVVTSETIATGAGVEHRAVLQLVATHEDALGQLGPSAFGMRKGAPLPQGGFAKGTRVALLNEQQATLVLALMRNTDAVVAFKVALVKAFFDMAQRLGAPITLTGPQLMAAALIEAQATLEQHKAQVLELTPRAEAFDAFLSTTGDYSVNEAAKILSRDHAILTGEKRLRDWMQANRWLYRDAGNKPRAYQTRIDQQVLAEKAQWHYHPETGEKVLDTPQVRVTAKGIQALAKALTKTTDQGELDTEEAS